MTDEAESPKAAGSVRLKDNRAMTAVCQPPSYWAIDTSAANISVTNIAFANVNPLWPYCSDIPRDEVVRAASDEITRRCAGNYTQHCSGCVEFPLADFNKTRTMRGHATVFIKRDGTIVDRPTADCQIDFDYSFDFVMKGEIGLCFSASLRLDP
jgi:hypothetical protein